MELYVHSSNTPSWRGAQLKYRNNFMFTVSHSDHNVVQLKHGANNHFDAIIRSRFTILSLCTGYSYQEHQRYHFSVIKHSNVPPFDQ